MPGTVRRLTLLTLGLILLCAACEPDAAPRPSSGESFSILTLNIWHDQEDWPARRTLIVEQLNERAPDVICLQEVLQKPGLPNQARTLADSLGYHYYFASVDGPESKKRYGNAILSRHPIVERGWKALRPEDDYRTVAHVRIQRNGHPIDIYNTHLHYGGEDGGTSVRRMQIRDLLAFVDSTHADGVTILAGDFNAPPDAPELRPIKESFVDAYAAHQAQQADSATTLNPQFGHTPRRIDYVFFERSPRLQLQDTDIIFHKATQDSVWASDHFGVLSRFSLDSPS